MGQKDANFVFWLTLEPWAVIWGLENHTAPFGVFGTPCKIICFLSDINSKMYRKKWRELVEYPVFDEMNGLHS